jgi:N-acetylglucosamine-6-phosphate deacetylase
MIIKNALVYCENKSFEKKNIYIENGIFSSRSSDKEIIDAEGLYAVPSFIDIHFHGCAGFDFCDGNDKAISAIAKYQAKCGIGAIVPATMTLSSDELISIMQTASIHKKQKGEAYLAGINLEGPYINKNKRGAQSAEYIRPCNIKEYRLLQNQANGLIKIVCIAPEISGADEFIKELHDEVNISLAHTEADYECAKRALEGGANHITHLFNAMPPFAHRSPGVVGAALDSDCYVELICDGIHIHPAVVRSVFKMFGAERVVLISDSMRAAGMPDGEYTLGGQLVSVRGKYATLTYGGALAGSVTNLYDCFKTAVCEMNIPLQEALYSATAAPAKSAGIFDRFGSIAYGKIANVNLIDKDLNLVKAIIF